jgi:hypothetical protein
VKNPFPRKDGEHDARSEKIRAQEQVAELALKRADEVVRRGELLRAAAPAARDRVP